MPFTRLTPGPIAKITCLFLLAASLPRTQAQTAQGDYIVPSAFANLSSSVLASLFAGWTPFSYLSSTVSTLSDTTVTALACLPGSYAPANSQTCTYCPKGKYSTLEAAPDSSTCLACPAGTYSEKLGANSPTDCQSCPSNTYYEGTAAASVDSCLACPANTNSDRPQLRQNCICNNGYTGPGGTRAHPFCMLYTP